jgi:hypothetical protein
MLRKDKVENRRFFSKANPWRSTPLQRSARVLRLVVFVWKPGPRQIWISEQSHLRTVRQHFPFRCLPRTVDDGGHAPHRILRLLLAAFEMAVGILILSKDRYVKIGLIASVLFNLFLVQLGLGSP